MFSTVLLSCQPVLRFVSGCTSSGHMAPFGPIYLEILLLIGNKHANRTYPQVPEPHSNLRLHFLTYFSILVGMLL